MKNIPQLVIFISLILLPLLSHAQAGFECSYREYCNFNDLNARLESCEGFTEVSYFELNESGTELTHFTTQMTSYYFIHSRFYDAQTGVLELNVTSDANNPYTFYINERKKEIRVFFEDKSSYGLVANFKISESY